MSITAETAKEHANDLAVTCCRFEAGTAVDVSILEDPAIFADLEDSGLLEFPENALKIGEVLGGKLKVTVDALTPLTSEHVDGITVMAGEVEETPVVEAAPVAAPAAPAVQATATATAGVIKIHIGEGKDINLEIPMIGAAQAVAQPVEAAVAASTVVAPVAEVVQEAKELRRLTKKHFKIDTVELGEETKIEGTKLVIRKDLLEEAAGSQKLVVSVKVDIITPDKYNTYSETIMDVQPIATKEEGELGLGVTRVLDGVVMVVTGLDENGVQIGEFGSSEGELETNIMWGRPGAPDRGAILIKTEVLIQAGTGMERPGPLAAHLASDQITAEIRNALNEASESLVVETEELVQYRRPGKKKIVVIKEIMGQGAMHDNLILPMEPVGTLGAQPNVDLGNMPVMLSPLEVLDGGIHALTCIGPASKENSRHYYREPLVIEAMNDEEIDLAGVIFVGSPQVNSEKFYVSKRLGMLIESMDVDGAIITTEGFGNNHIDFASHHEQIGMRGIARVGVTFSANQGALVVGNKYMTHMIDNNKSKQGIENEVLSNNTLCKEDAERALVMIKAAIAGEEVKVAERKWNANVKLNNVSAIEEGTGAKLELTDNEQVLAKSKKRLEIYEVE